MPFCFNCGKEIYLIKRYINVKDCTCENCKANFSVVEKGQVNQKDLDRAYNEYQHNYFLTMKPGKTYRQIVGEMLKKEAYDG